MGITKTPIVTRHSQVTRLLCAYKSWDTLTLVTNHPMELGALRFSGYWFRIIHRTLCRDDGRSDILAHPGTQIAGDYASVGGHSVLLTDTPSIG
jgi:hypothetical protein